MIGSVCLQFGIALTGLAISLPYQIAVSLSVGERSLSACLARQRVGVHARRRYDPMLLTGLGIDYFLDTRITRASWIFPGLFCFSLATIFGTFAHLARLKALRARRWASRSVLLPTTVDPHAHTQHMHARNRMLMPTQVGRPKPHSMAVALPPERCQPSLTGA